MNTAVLRFEASHVIGAGHAIRCMVLANFLQKQGWKVHIVTSQETQTWLPVLQSSKRLDPEHFFAHPVSCELLVVDHYGLDKKYEAHFRPFVNKILVIDDLANRAHDCDVLVDQTYGRHPHEYSHLVPPNCHILTGSKYALIRDAFGVMRPKALAKRRTTTQIKRINLSLGSNPPLPLLNKAVDALVENGFSGTLDIVLGIHPTEPNPTALTEKPLPFKLNLLINPNMPQCLYEADLAIGAPGSSTWERCSLGLPFISMLTADNQKTILKQFTKENRTAGLEQLSQVLENPKILQDNTSLVDGFGVNRIVEALTETHPISLRPVNLQDKQMVFDWQQIKAIRQYANHPKAPTWEEHEAWFTNRLEKFENPYWIIEYQKKPCGALSLDYDNSESNFVLSWYLDPAYHGKGIGTVAVQKAVALVWPIPIKAQVKPDNMASHKALKNANFKQISPEYYLSSPAS